MILHIASFRWVDGVDDARVAALTAALRDMAEAVPELRYYACGPNLHLRAGGADYGVAALVDDGAGLDAYLDSEAHQRVYRDYLGAMIAERQAVQLPVDDLAVVGARIAAS